MTVRRVLPVVLAALFAVLFGAWHAGHPQRMTPDSMEYARIALQFAGASETDARAEAALVRCVGLYRDPVGSYAERIPEYASQEGVAARAAEVQARVDGRYADVPEEWLGECGVYVLDHPVTSDARYPAIFESRPGYPMLVALTVGFVTPYAGLLLVSVLAAAVAGLLVVALARALGWSWPAALTAQVLAYLLPTGLQGARPLTEGTTWFAASLMLLGIALAAFGRTAPGLVVQVLGAVLLVATRYPTALFLGGFVLAALALLVLLRRMSLATAARLGAGSALGVVAALVVPPLLHWSSSADSLQDMVTDHFTKPDLGSPWIALVHDICELVTTLAADPYFLLAASAVVTAVAAILWADRRPVVAIVVVAPLVVACFNILAHPALGESKRLFSFAAISVALAAAGLVSRILAARVSATHEGGDAA